MYLIIYSLYFHCNNIIIGHLIAQCIALYFSDYYDTQRPCVVAVYYFIITDELETWLPFPTSSEVYSESAPEVPNNVALVVADRS